MTSTDYTSIDPPQGKDPQDYHYTERRAELLQLIFKAGSPKRLNTTNLANRYGVTRRQIYLDYDRLGEFIEANLGKRAQLRTQALYEKVMDEMIESGDFRGAWRTTMEWNEWLENRGALERTPDKLEADVTTREAGTETEEYEIVSGEDDGIVAEPSEEAAEAGLAEEEELEAESGGE